MMGPELIGYLLAALAAIGIAYQCIALIAVRHFFARQANRADAVEGVTILKPLHGIEPRLGENLTSCLDQDYHGAVQMICGVVDGADPAVAAVDLLKRGRPGASITLVVDPVIHGASAKIGNLINMYSAAQHDVLVLSDSDMAVGREYLSTLVGTLAQPGVGAVTCLYRGRGDTGLWSQLSASIIDYVALPDMVVAYISGLERPCLGQTIALRRETLAAVGGFARFADILADDHAIGAAVAQSGQSVVIPPMLLVHCCAETSFGALWRQKLRWAATIRSIAPLKYTASIVTRPLPLALLAAILLPTTGMALAGAALAIRGLVAATINCITGERSARLWLLPVVDCVEFTVFLASFVVRTIDWRGNRLTMVRGGRITA